MQLKSEIDQSLFCRISMFQCFAGLQVIISVLTSILLDEVNSSEVASSSLNVCSEVISRLAGFCPQAPSCQVRSHFCSGNFWFLVFCQALRFCYFVFCPFSLVLSGSPWEVRAASLVQQLLPGYLRFPDPAAAQVSTQPSSSSGLQHRLYHVRERLVTVCQYVSFYVHVFESDFSDHTNTPVCALHRAFWSDCQAMLFLPCSWFD